MQKLFLPQSIINKRFKNKSETKLNFRQTNDLMSDVQSNGTPTNNDISMDNLCLSDKMGSNGVV